VTEPSNISPCGLENILEGEVSHSARTIAKVSLRHFSRLYVPEILKISPLGWARAYISRTEGEIFHISLTTSL